MILKIRSIQEVKLHTMNQKIYMHTLNAYIHIYKKIKLLKKHYACNLLTFEPNNL